MARSRRSSAERRHQRNIDRAAVERAINFVYTRCDICGAEFVVNNNHEQKVQLKAHKLGDFVICSTCRCVVNGRVLTKGTIDWARRYVQMYILLERLATISPEGSQLRKLLKAMEDERPRRRLYRKAKVQVQA